jgi:hypothetical protein
LQVGLDGLCGGAQIGNRCASPRAESPSVRFLLIYLLLALAQGDEALYQFLDDFVGAMVDQLLNVGERDLKPVDELLLELDKIRCHLDRLVSEAELEGEHVQPNHVRGVEVALQLLVRLGLEQVDRGSDCNIELGKSVVHIDEGLFITTRRVCEDLHLVLELLLCLLHHLLEAALLLHRELVERHGQVVFRADAVVVEVIMDGSQLECHGLLFLNHSLFLVGGEPTRGPIYRLRQLMLRLRSATLPI